MRGGWCRAGGLAAWTALAACLPSGNVAWAEVKPGASATVELGRRVRLRAPGLGRDSIEGTLIRVEGDAIVIHRAKGGPLPVPRKAITRLEVCTGQRSLALHGLRKGALIGGIWMGAACLLYADCDGWLSPAAGGALAGAVIGVGVGAMMKGDRWQAVPLAEVRVGLAPVPQGARVVVSIAF